MNELTKVYAYIAGLANFGLDDVVLKNE